MTNKELEKLGYDEWFEDANNDGVQEGLCYVRVIEVNKNSYIVSDGMHEMLAELSGKFLFNTENKIDFPTVGDWVTIQAFDNYSLAIIHSVLPRKTLLKRKDPGKNIDFQLIASNIDFGLIVQSADDINFNLLDRYLVMLNECKIQPIAVFSKIDLLLSAEMEKIKDKLKKLKDPYLLISNMAEKGIEDLSEKLIAGKTYCLLGQSGVGKTSLLNRLFCTTMLKVSDVRKKDGKGRHTTVRRQLICLDSGSIIIDTPGMRELGNFEIEQGLELTFDEFSSYASECLFKDCTHTQEDGCALREAVKNGTVEESRYLNFLKLRKESEYYTMSYQEKRQKDKSFGKLIKNYKKYKRQH